ncbi:MAG: hypothetical protein P8X95_12305 [Anaerolineales bacterium]
MGAAFGLPPAFGVIRAQALATWSLQAAAHFQPPRLKRGPGGRPAFYRESSILQLLFFFLALGAQLLRLRVIRGQELIVDSSMIAAWSADDPGATRQKYAEKGKPKMSGTIPKKLRSSRR